MGFSLKKAIKSVVKNPVKTIAALAATPVVAAAQVAKTVTGRNTVSDIIKTTSPFTVLSITNPALKKTAIIGYSAAGATGLGIGLLGAKAGMITGSLGSVAAKSAMTTPVQESVSEIATGNLADSLPTLPSSGTDPIADTVAKPGIFDMLLSTGSAAAKSALEKISAKKSTTVSGGTVSEAGILSGNNAVFLAFGAAAFIGLLMLLRKR